MSESEPVRTAGSIEAARDVSPPMVLIASDQEWSARSLESVLGPHGFAALRAYNGKQVLELIQRAHPDVVIVDAGLPDMSGVDLCARLRADPDFLSSTPVVMITAGPASRAQRLEAYRAGVWEYVSLPVDTEALLLKLSAFVRARRELDRSREESLLDGSTGLYNVRGLARRAREIGADAARRHTPLACVAVTAQLADTANGDELDPRLAVELAEVCRRAARTSDAVGRLGRAEFAIIAPATGESGAARLAERLRDVVASAEFSVATSPVRLSLRAGYCAVGDFASAPVDAVEMMLRASAALRHTRASAAGSISAWADVPRPAVR